MSFNIDPVAFRIGNFEVMWYGVLIALGMFLAGIVGTNLAKKDPLLYKDAVVDYCLYALPLGVLGARIYYVIFSWDYYSAHLGEILAIRNGGLAIYGGIIVGVIVAVFFTRFKKLPFWNFMDCVAPGVVLAQGIGRWGNFINQEAYGRPTNLPWAINIDGVLVHPTFLYESIWDILIFLFLYFYLAKHKKFNGQLLATYFILYGIGRFFIEGLRTDSLYFLNFRVSQLVSIGLVLIGLGIYLLRGRKNIDVAE